MTADRKTKNLLGGVVGAILFLALCFAPAAMAAGEFEPNDDFDVAYGPLAAGATYSATLENGDDLDTYYFFVAGQGGTPVEITIADTSQGAPGSMPNSMTPTVSRSTSLTSSLAISTRSRRCWSPAPTT